MANDKTKMIGIFGALGFLLSMVLATGSMELFDNLPTDQLTLTQPACQYLMQAGIGSEVKNGICSINVKFRKKRSNEGGVIEQPNLQPIEISPGQVVAIMEVDDGSKEPWTPKFWISLAWMMVSILGVLGSAILINGR